MGQDPKTDRPADPDALDPARTLLGPLASPKAYSIADLARKLGIAPGPATSTVNIYCEAIIEGKDDPVGKIRFRSVITQAPYCGIDISFPSRGLLVAPALPLGGLKVDGQSGEVLDESGGKIQGLYAAGKNAAGNSSNCYVSGLALADCVFSSMRAGQHAADRPLDAR
ncbi:hypothetical protein F5Y19DRAFT_441642 [Xylariaceae sp. FL1651]|nr:hypothetical protein F5Y19DRAFT_441642 [Xylariaceae sp. FL1651]